MLPLPCPSASVINVSITYFQLGYWVRIQRLENTDTNLDYRKILVNGCFVTNDKRSFKIRNWFKISSANCYQGLSLTLV